MLDGESVLMMVLCEKFDLSIYANSTISYMSVLTTTALTAARSLLLPKRFGRTPSLPPNKPTTQWGARLVRNPLIVSVRART